MYQERPTSAPSWSPASSSIGGLSYDSQLYAPSGFGGLSILGGVKTSGSTWTWFRKAAEGGEGWAQASLGEAYLKGEGVPQNLAAARSWFKKSAEQENPLGQYCYGMVLIKGQGGARDVAAGAAFLAEAAAGGSEEALATLANMDW
jgi:hypothetical protein